MLPAGGAARPGSPPAAGPEIRVGDLVRAPVPAPEGKRGRTAVVRFTGFAGGDWVGVELGRPEGRNDGSVNGTRYFECMPGHGLFVRRQAVSMVTPGKPVPTSSRARRRACQASGASAAHVETAAAGAVGSRCISEEAPSMFDEIVIGDTVEGQRYKRLNEFVRCPSSGRLNWESFVKVMRTMLGDRVTERDLQQEWVDAGGAGITVSRLYTLLVSPDHYYVPFVLDKVFELADAPWVQAGISQEKYDHIVTQFVALDTNGDQVLSRKEFESVSGLPEFFDMSRDDISQLFDAVDVDQNQTICMNEFLKYMAKRKDHHPLPAQVDPQRGRLEDMMQHFGFVFCTTEGGHRGAIGDGNCQFYSLSWGLYRTTRRHAELRAEVVRHMRGPGRDDFEVFYAPSHPGQPATYDAYLGRMSRDRAWGDHLTLQAAAALHGLDVRLLTADAFGHAGGGADPSRPYLSISSPTARPRVVWMSFAAQHYDPIEPTSTTPRGLLC
ncbi:unnamed protein product [Prorocentrum cordatum]|uniref:Calmodulin n=1 Tax=Prorocentrum cordatum TaxID=2364126 RepID=A0ABN9PHQ9_9DINO|nr:unnamed protein product [Polarella glacialis]